MSGEPSQPKRRRPNAPGRAIISTMHRPGPSLKTWIDYHLDHFDQIYIFADDFKEQPLFEQFSNRVVVFGGAREPWGSGPDELSARQFRNIDRGIAYALGCGIDWLVHLDDDELFFDRGITDWAMTNAGMVRFQNHEALSPLEPVRDLFTVKTLFRVAGKMEFAAYVNGKSAGRVSRNLQNNGAHVFQGYTGEVAVGEGSGILHYPLRSFEQWLAKYRLLGKFSDYWFGNPNNPNTIPFMTGSRDIIARCDAEGSIEPAREFYAKWSILPEQRREYLAAGMLMELDPLRDSRSVLYTAIEPAKRNIEVSH